MAQLFAPGGVDGLVDNLVSHNKLTDDLPGGGGGPPPPGPTYMVAARGTLFRRIVRIVLICVGL
jgi:hypothetical protein